MTISEKLSKILWEAVDFASAQIKKGHSPFVPFILAQDGDKNEMIVSEEIEGSQVRERGLQVVAERNPARAVFCYDGYLTIGERRKDVIYAIACEAGDKEANIFARPYKPKAFLRPFVLFENLARYGVAENPLAHRVPERTFSPADHPLRTTLDRRYLDMRAAMASGEAESIAAMLAPNFRSIDLQGQEKLAQAMIESVLRLKIDRSKRTANTTLVEIEENGDTARVLQHYSMTMAGDVEPPLPRKLQTLSIDRWARAGDAWLLEVTQTREVESISGSGEHRYGKATTKPL